MWLCKLCQNSFLRFNKVYPKPESTPTSDTPATPAAAPAVVFSACTSSWVTEILPALYVLPSVNVTPARLCQCFHAGSGQSVFGVAFKVFLHPFRFFCIMLFLSRTCHCFVSFFLTMNTPSYCRYIKVRRKKQQIYSFPNNIFS